MSESIFDNGVEIERTHDIVSLLARCSKFDSIFGTIDPMDITSFAVQGRYPDANLMPTKEEAEAYYQLALYVKSLVTERIIFS